MEKDILLAIHSYANPLLDTIVPVVTAAAALLMITLAAARDSGAPRVP